MSKGLAEELAAQVSDKLARILGGISGDYDYSKGGSANALGHYTDKGKMPWHPTFSSESDYATAEKPGGVWSNDKGQWVYTPSQQQMQTPGYIDSLARYYAYEKGKDIDRIDTPVPYNKPKEWN